MKLNLKINLDI